MTDESPEIAVLTPSFIRRVMSLLMLSILGILLIYLAFNSGATPVFGQVVLIGMGVGVLLVADRLRRATRNSITMTTDEIFDSSGTRICLVADIASVDRGAFAFKPSGGFLIRLNTSAGFHWSPGLWWRMGKRVGVGGATPQGQARFMAEAISARLSGLI